MQTMRVVFILLATLFAVPLAPKAQTTFNIDGGCLNVVDFTIGQPVGECGDRCYSTTYQHETFVNERLTIGAGVGYSYHNRYKFSAIPFFLSAHYFLLDKRCSPFANIKIGAYGKFGVKNVGGFEKYSLVDKDHEQAFDFYLSPCIGVKVHITPNIGVTASVADEAYLVKAFDVNDKDYRSGFTHSLGVNVGICFQIKGW